MTLLDTPELCCAGLPLDTSLEAFGPLRESTDHLHETHVLQERLREDGYLFLRGFLDRELVLKARESMLSKIQDPNESFSPDIAEKNPAVDAVLYGDRVLGLYERLLEGPIRHFDFTWVRTMGAGPGTKPHCDIVYMGRGTFDLYTAWVPYGEVSLELGGLMILENSHKQQDRLKSYLTSDVDEYCTNGRHAKAIESGERVWERDGALSTNAASLRDHLGGRWLTAEYQPGDFLTFGMATVHASVDNQTERTRLSTDSRYQRADQPVDERWIGENPIGHGTAGKRGRIC